MFTRCQAPHLRHPHPRHPPRRGYVLVLTLVVLALAAAGMVGLSRAAMLQSLAARRADEQLQRRWGALTCRATLLPNAEAILAREEQRSGRPAAAKQATIVLGRQTFDLVFADEQAKLNANAAVYYRGRKAAERAVRTVVRDAGPGRLDVRFLAGSERPVAPANAEDEDDAEGVALAAAETESPDDPADRADYRPIGSFGQVFSGAAPRELLRVGVTCWGDGGLRLKRAPAEAIVELCTPALDAAQVRRLVAIRDGRPDVPVARALDLLQVDADTRDEVEDRLTDQSACHSLWVVARGPERSWYHFAVEGSRSPDSIDSFEW